MITDQHRVSVVIPTLGRDTLERTRAALAQQTRPADEVIIVLDYERRGIGWTTNEGLRRATGDLIAFTDDDCVPPPDWLARLIQAVDRHEAAGAGGTFCETDPLLMEIRRRQRYPLVEEVDQVGYVGNSGNVMYRRSWLEECLEKDGYIYNPALNTGEDWELVWRLRQRGARLVFVPNPVTHLRRAPLSVYLRHQFGRGIGIAQLYILHRQDTTALPAQDSLLWGTDGRRTRANWLAAFWRKIVGPFDVGSFRRKRHFAQFWLGEKFQALGFAWGLCQHFAKR